MTAALRQARSTDAGRAGDILWETTFRDPWMPDLFNSAEAIACCGEMIDRGWVTVATTDGTVQAFLARDGEEVNALYVAAAAARQGLGRLLLDDAKTRCDRLQLRVHADNTSALRFYLRCGFVETGRSDGAGNDEGLPDIALTWSQEAKP